MTYVALLRGINVGGHNKVPMKELAKIMLALGCGEVRTYIQSGNVLFRAADTAQPRAWANEISLAIYESFGLRVPVVLRTLAGMRTLVQSNPFLTAGAAVEHVHVTYLSRHVGESVLEKADEQRFAPDVFCAAGRDLYLWVPTGFVTSKLPVYLDKRLKGADVIATTRNWRTTLQLLQMAEESAGS